MGEYKDLWKRKKELQDQVEKDANQQHTHFNRLLNRMVEHCVELKEIEIKLQVMENGKKR